MTYLHSFWTRPKQDPAGGEKDIVLKDFEALTWLVSALQAMVHQQRAVALALHHGAAVA